ncbi:hypothetical protein R3P38DRAFT_2826235 [Favolaschia claudopus]|uniref:Uncharacterized protein n=1 Tax=Favolaschia claudopus TaxID=2862362 RepID=A0AAW0EJI8_9AGAR
MSVDPRGYETLPVERHAYLRFGYNRGTEDAAETPPDSAGLNLRSYLGIAGVLGRNKGTEPLETDFESRLGVFLAQCREAKSLDMIASNLLDYHNKTSPIRQEWSMDISSFVCKDEVHYRILERSRPGPFCIILSSATTTLEIVRNKWGPHIASVAQQLLRRGMAFRLCSVTTEPAAGLSHNTATQSSGKLYPGLGYRPLNYKPDNLDYEAYTMLRDQFLKTPRGRVAVRYGGIVGRLARAVLPYDAQTLLLPNSTAGRILHDGWIDEAYSEDQLTPDELDLICGVYHIDTGQQDTSSAGARQVTTVSWWPKPANFATSGLNLGWWSPACEHWYQRRLEQIANENVSLSTAAAWKHNLKYDRQVPGYVAGVERCSRWVLEALRPI